MPERTTHRRWESRASTASSSRMSTRMRESVRMRGSKSGGRRGAVSTVGFPTLRPSPSYISARASPLAVSSDAGSDQALQKPPKLGSAMRARTKKV